jgi:hypothetical protein
VVHCARPISAPEILKVLEDVEEVLVRTAIDVDSRSSYGQ